MAHQGSHCVYTRLSLTNLNAMREAAFWERKIAKSKRTSKVTLAWEKPEENNEFRLERPSTILGKRETELLVTFEAASPEYSQVGRRDYSRSTGCLREITRLLNLGFICVNPRNPDKCEHAITRKGMDYVNWLRSKK